MKNKSLRESAEGEIRDAHEFHSLVKSANARVDEYTVLQRLRRALAE